MSLIIYLILPIISVFLFIKWNGNRKSLPLPPGPSLLDSLRIIKNCIANNDIHLVGERMAKQYGEICNIRFLGKNMVFLNSTHIIRKLLATAEHKDATNDRPFTFLRNHIFGGGDIAFSDYDHRLIKLRKLVHKVVRLYGEGIKDFEDMVTSELYVLEERLLKSMDEPSYDLGRALSQSVVRILHVFLTNERLNEAETGPVCSLIEDFDLGVNKVGSIDIHVVISLLPWLQYLPGEHGRLARALKQDHQRVLDYFLNPQKIEKLKGNGSLIGSLFAEQEDDVVLTDNILFNVVCNMVAAGFITTKSTLCGIFLLMMHYPDVQRKIQRELDEKLKDKRPGLEDRSELHYTNAVILECLRYMRHIPLGLTHRVKEDIEIDGYRIPAKTTLITNFYAANRNDKTWENPNVFFPERFLDKEGKVLSSDHPIRQQFIPFGIGRRACLGETFAKSRIFLYVTFLLQKFEFHKGDNELVSDDSSTWVSGAAFCPKFLKCSLKKRTP